MTSGAAVDRGGGGAGGGGRGRTYFVVYYRYYYYAWNLSPSLTLSPVQMWGGPGAAPCPS